MIELFLPPDVEELLQERAEEIHREPEFIGFVPGYGVNPDEWLYEDDVWDEYTLLLFTDISPE